MNRLAGHGVILSGLRGHVSGPFKSDVKIGKKQLKEMGGMELHVQYPGGVIDAMHFLRDPEAPMSCKTMIFFPGMGDAYELFGIWGIAEENLLLQYKRAGFNVVLWNYPHVLDSTGAPSLNNIIQAADALLHVLLYTFEVPENQLLIHAHSMGGGIATFFLTRRNEENKLKFPLVSLCNDRSFSSLAQVIKSLTNNMIPVPGSLLGRIAGKFVSEVCKWNLNTIEYWNPSDTRGYYWCIHNIDDSMIPNKSSLGYALRMQKRDLDRIIELSPCNESHWGTELRNYSEIYAAPCHNRPLYHNEWENN